MRQTRQTGVTPKWKIRIQYDLAPETKGAVRAWNRTDALAMVTPDPRYKVTKIYCEEIPWTQACLFSDDWDERCKR
jgi:hypothetical protein